MNDQVRNMLGCFDSEVRDSILQRQDLSWHPADDPDFVLDGLCWHRPGEPFRRLPLDFSLSKGVDECAWQTAGVMLRFKTDASEIRVAAKAWHNCRMDHMPATGSMGFDLYEGSGSGKTFVKNTRFDWNRESFETPVLEAGQNSSLREYTLHFPLYSGVEALLIGLPEKARILPPSPWPDPRPVVIYGTSIQQGGCVSRPGMFYANRVSRMLDRPFLSFGFSGWGLGEPEMARQLAEIRNPAMYIIDYDANSGVDGLRRTLPGFIDILREAHPETPVLLVSRLVYAREFQGDAEYAEERRRLTLIHLNELTRRREAGDRNIHFLDGSSLYGPDPSECTVDGVHPTDLGAYEISRRLAPVVERILNRQ